MEDFFKELFDYSHHFNQQFIQLFLANPEKSSEKALKLMSHIINAHSVWNARIEHKTSPFGVWEMHDTDKLLAIENENYQCTIQILENKDLSKMIAYTTSNGQPFNSIVKDILFHIINHSTYHRAQISSEWRQNGVAPIMSDYIFYNRTSKQKT